MIWQRNDEIAALRAELDNARRAITIHADTAAARQVEIDRLTLEGVKLRAELERPNYGHWSTAQLALKAVTKERDVLLLQVEAYRTALERVVRVLGPAFAQGALTEKPLSDAEAKKIITDAGFVPVKPPDCGCEGCFEEMNSALKPECEPDCRVHHYLEEGAEKPKDASADEERVPLEHICACDGTEPSRECPMHRGTEKQKCGCGCHAVNKGCSSCPACECGGYA
jgi:hypothetical protein